MLTYAPLSRRKVCTILMAFYIAVLSASKLGATSDTHRKNDPQLAKHIILFIGDGMQLAHEIATSRYLFGRDDSLVFHSFPYRGNVATWDVTTYNYWAKRHKAPVFQPDQIQPWLGYDIFQGGLHPYPIQTDRIDSVYLNAVSADSASAATAWATGHKTDGGNIAWRFGDPPDGQLTTIAEILRSEMGFAIGVISTVPFSHATTAAHLSHKLNRYDTKGIAKEIIHSFQPDVVIGGGHPQWYERFTYLYESDYTSLKENGAGSVYKFIERKADTDGADALSAATREAISNNKKLFGLFGGRDGNFDSPQPQNRPDDPLMVRATIEDPLLKDCVTAALSILSRKPRGFFVMFEQGGIDWANHDNDYQRMIGTVWDLDNAVRTAIAYIEQPGDGIDWSNTLLIVTADHGNSLMRFVKHLDRGELPRQINAAGMPCYTDYCGKYLYPGNEVHYGSSGHTNELVRLYAMGSGIGLFEKYNGSWYPGTKILDNTQIFHVIIEAVGLNRTDENNVRNNDPIVEDVRALTN